MQEFAGRVRQDYEGGQKCERQLAIEFNLPGEFFAELSTYLRKRVLQVLSELEVIGRHRARYR